jgi:hypothetical protein
MTTSDHGNHEKEGVGVIQQNPHTPVCVPLCSTLSTLNCE